MDPFSDESLSQFEAWRRASAANSLRRSSGILGYLWRGAALGALYGIASIAGYPGVAEALVIVAIIAYYCGQATARSKRS